MELLRRGREWIAYFDSLTERNDELKTKMSIPDFLKYLNSPEQLRLTLGRYLVGQIEVGGNGDYSGADMRTAWYNRNIRIFSNIQRIPLDKDERVLVIIGQGHVPILRHLMELDGKRPGVCPDTISTSASRAGRDMNRRIKDEEQSSESDKGINVQLLLSIRFRAAS